MSHIYLVYVYKSHIYPRSHIDLGYDHELKIGIPRKNILSFHYYLIFVEVETNFAQCLLTNTSELCIWVLIVITSLQFNRF